MSGGVDSSVAAFLLKEKGYEVVGATMRLKNGKEITKEAEAICKYLNIPFYEFDFREIFEEKVIKYFINEYSLGRTPNPCIACNKYLKFDEFLKKAKELNAYYIATGHYAKIEYNPNFDRYLVKKSVSTDKDQTYVLYNLMQSQLKHILMPLGYYDKVEIREIAKTIGLDVANKRDSQEICFVEDNDYIGFIKNKNISVIKPGNFIDTEGRVLGEHKGIINYTIGQRKGLGIAVGRPLYVVDIITEKNLVVLGDENQIFKNELIANNLNFILFDYLKKPIKVKAKIRYSAKEANATLIPIDDKKAKIIFEQPQRAITKGQSVVFYIEDILVGGGIISL